MAFEDSEVEEEAFMNVIEEVGDLLVAIKRHAEMLPPAARAKSPISSRTFERRKSLTNTRPKWRRPNDRRGQHTNQGCL